MTDWIDLSRTLRWLGPGAIYLCNESAEPVLTRELLRLGFSIATLDGTKIDGEQAFFAEASAALRFPEYFGRNWDAFVDCFGDLAYRPEKRQAILWKDASASLKADFYAFVRSMHELLNAARDLGWIDAPHGPVQMEVFFLGKAPEFAKRP